MNNQDEPRDESAKDGSSAAPLPWPSDPQDPEAAAIGESWTALDQLIRAADVTRLDAAAQSRLVRAVERRSRRRAVVGWGLTLAAAAAVLFVLAIQRDGPEQIAGVAPTPSSPNTTADPKSTADPNTTMAPQPPLVSTAQPTVAPNPEPAVASSPAARSEAADLAAEFWSDDFADLESVRLQALEVELSWRRDIETPALLRQRFDELQADWNDRSL